MLFSDVVFNIFAGVFDVLNDVRQNITVVLLFLHSIIPNLDAIFRVCMLLCETSMLLFVSVCFCAKPPGLQRARLLWSGASDKLIMPILPTQRKFILLSIWQRLRGNCLRTFRTTCLTNLDSDSKESVFDRVETLYI